MKENSGLHDVHHSDYRIKRGDILKKVARKLEISEETSKKKIACIKKQYNAAYYVANMISRRGGRSGDGVEEDDDDDGRSKNVWKWYEHCSFLRAKDIRMKTTSTQHFVPKKDSASASSTISKRTQREQAKKFPTRSVVSAGKLLLKCKLPHVKLNPYSRRTSTSENSLTPNPIHSSEVFSVLPQSSFEGPDLLSPSSFDGHNQGYVARSPKAQTQTPESSLDLQLQHSQKNTEVDEEILNTMVDKMKGYMKNYTRKQQLIVLSETSIFLDNLDKQLKN